MRVREKLSWYPFIAHLSVSSILITFVISLITTTTTSLYAQEKLPEVKLITQQLAAVEKQPLKSGLKKKLPNKPQVEMERTRFRALILANPNYFGNIKDSPFTPVLNIQGNTKYEEICSVGFQPQLSQLEAVVYVNKPYGYGGGVCSNGTKEYVRFYVSFDNKVTWNDMGVESFTAYNIPGTTHKRPLEYAVIRQVNLPKKSCLVSNLIHARAILSWNVPPPADTPAFLPIWGEVHDTHIQIDRRKWWVFEDWITELALKPHIPPKKFELLDLTQTIVTAEPKVLGAKELQALYKDKGVEPHRFALPELQQLISDPSLGASLMAPGFKGVCADLDIDLMKIVDKLFPNVGNTRYEELECIGLEPNQDRLVGVIRVKLPGGYSGGLCTAGSKEYVTFWADFDNDGTFDTCLGITSVNVYDFTKIPKGGLEYAVSLPVNLNSHRQKCTEGPKVVKIRATLSWQIPVPCGLPDKKPIWGNSKETLIHIKPGPTPVPGDRTPYMDSVGDMGVCTIDQATGQATGTGIISSVPANKSPFGGIVTITGFFNFPPNVMAGIDDPFKYKVYVRKLPGGSLQPLANDFDVVITEQSGINPPVQYTATQSIDVNGYYTYQEQLYIGNWRKVAGRVLAKWRTGVPMTGMWEISLEAKFPDATTLPAGIIDCTDGSTRSSVKVRLDEVRPTADIQITGFSRGGGPIEPAGDCGTLLVGDVIYGTYSTTDEHFNQLTLTVEPVVPAGGATVSPSSRAYPIVPTTGESMKTWTLDTTGMQACGYIVRLWVQDRTIVSSGSFGWRDSTSVGLCLELPTTE